MTLVLAAPPRGGGGDVPLRRADKGLGVWVAARRLPFEYSRGGAAAVAHAGPDAQVRFAVAAQVAKIVEDRNAQLVSLPCREIAGRPRGDREEITG